MLVPLEPGVWDVARGGGAAALAQPRGSGSRRSGCTSGRRHPCRANRGAPDRAGIRLHGLRGRRCFEARTTNPAYPTSRDELEQVRVADPDRMRRQPDVAEVAALTERVHGRSRQVEPSRRLPHGQQRIRTIRHVALHYGCIDSRAKSDAKARGRGLRRLRYLNRRSLRPRRQLLRRLDEGYRHPRGPTAAAGPPLPRGRPPRRRILKQSSRAHSPAAVWFRARPAHISSFGT